MMNNADQQVVYLQDGRESAMSFFIKEFSQPLLFFAWKIVKDKSVAEELVSDAFVKLWERRSNFSSSDSIKSFLFLVTRNAGLDVLKQKRNRFQHDDSLLLDLESEDPDMLTKIIYIELIEQIAAEVEKLPNKQRQVVQLSIMEGKDNEEICSELGTSLSTVYFARSKAISTLKQVFKRKNISYKLLIISFISSVMYYTSLV
ncbi:RNA polymerase sigma factor [Sphingobacterium sp. MYb382]|uniref:RNA polymerase sigma factor n=1 Tax=Sphingobacterium sp. MYb382 TaxID=2745278 RepID=UPI00309E41D3